MHDQAEEWTWRQKSVLALCALAIVLDGFDAQVIGFAAPAMLTDWGIAKADLAPIRHQGVGCVSLGASARSHLRSKTRVPMVRIAARQTARGATGRQ
ncbi:hypothetical protein [Sphingopyxis flava]|uniref:Uncharacterized protein n=1 Tax=Sphingopyxis flava TaxID=1507287 RepID=A0A1T5GDE3_9SPHN|nr:hypothetical protein [Sphingopyxis flava]SKC06361.1 hypothetical protein SAMN06295937_10704 [Sphingopyxis flava]